MSVAMRGLLLLGAVMMVNAQLPLLPGLDMGGDTCPQLTEAGVNAIDKQAIATACYTPKRDHSWNPCDKCLCAVTQQLAKVGG
jgi:hypothetical protein